MAETIHPKKLPPVIKASPELLQKMQRLSEEPAPTYEEALAQVQASLRQRNASGVKQGD